MQIHEIWSYQGNGEPWFPVLNWNLLRLKEWVAKKAEKEKEREEKRKERMERRRAVPNHKFDDPLYDKQIAVVAENQEDALQIGKLSI